MTHVWGYRIPVLVVPAVLTYAVVALAWLWLGRGRWATTLERVLLTGAVVFATAVTMSPPGTADRGVLRPDRSCAIHSVSLGWSAVAADDQRVLNVALLVPAGLFAAVVASRLPRWRALAVVVGAAMLPLAFEGGQQVFRGLHRACDTTDLADNLTGLLLGLLASTLVVALRSRTGVRRRPSLE